MQDRVAEFHGRAGQVARWFLAIEQDFEAVA